MMKRLPSLLFLLAFLLYPAVAPADDEPGDFSTAELDQMLAPIALYPDQLLSQILMASTYPLEVVAAARWSRENPGLEGKEAVEAVSDKDWDPSVKALVAFPELLGRLDDDLEWTQRLGDAFLLQEGEVMDRVQYLRQRACEAGGLDSMEHVRVERERETIVIRPAKREVVYVPYYRPAVVYGTWWWPDYRPVYWVPPRHRTVTRVVWGPGIRVSSGFYYSRFDWPGRQIILVNVQRPARSFRSATAVRSPHFTVSRRWRHQAVHRRGVAYRSEALERRYGRTRASTPRERRVSDRRAGWVRRGQERSRADTWQRDRSRRGEVGRSTDRSVRSPGGIRVRSGGGERRQERVRSERRADSESLPRFRRTGRAPNFTTGSQSEGVNREASTRRSRPESRSANRSRAESRDDRRSRAESRGEQRRSRAESRGERRSRAESRSERRSRAESRSGPRSRAESRGERRSRAVTSRSERRSRAVTSGERRSRAESRGERRSRTESRGGSRSRADSSDGRRSRADSRGGNRSRSENRSDRESRRSGSERRGRGGSSRR